MNFVLCEVKLTQRVTKIKKAFTYFTSSYEIRNAWFIVIEATSRKDGKLKVKLDDDDTKTFRLIKECDLQFYDGVASSPNYNSQTEEKSFEYYARK